MSDETKVTKAAVVGSGSSNRRAAAVMGVALAMGAMAESAKKSTEVFEEIDSLIPKSEPGFYNIGKEPMNAAQRVKRKRSKAARKARRNNR